MADSVLTVRYILENVWNCVVGLELEVGGRVGLLQTSVLE